MGSGRSAHVKRPAAPAERCFSHGSRRPPSSVAHSPHTIDPLFRTLLQIHVLHFSSHHSFFMHLSEPTQPYAGPTKLSQSPLSTVWDFKPEPRFLPTSHLCHSDTHLLPHLHNSSALTQRHPLGNKPEKDDLQPICAPKTLSTDTTARHQPCRILPFQLLPFAAYTPQLAIKIDLLAYSYSYQHQKAASTFCR